VSSQFGDSAYAASTAPEGYTKIYRSPIVGLDNRWELWKGNSGVNVISIRGTTKNNVSWLANFYAAMVPAKGQLHLSKDQTFDYELASHPRAAVHVGWLIATAFLATDMLPRIDSSYKAGTKEFAIVGHSQGGAIAYLLTAYLYHLQRQTKLPADIRFKTYCSAAPKPGNLYFAYEYEALTQEGWAYNVVNSADWVPQTQTPVSIQTLNDFNELNPFTNAKTFIKKQKWPKRWALNYAYGGLTKPSRKALKNYQKYLGQFVSKSVLKNLEGFAPPEYYNSNDYVRTGNTIVLFTDDDYLKEFPQDKKNVFVNHFHGPYLYLANKLFLIEEMKPTLDGSWQLTYISGIKIALEGLYPERKPVLNLDEANKRFSGNTSCNSFSGVLTIEENKLHFPETMMMTKMFCQGEGEASFVNALKIVDSYAIEGNTLKLLVNNVPVMKFTRN
jgi:heat shock protein HslJ